MLLALFAGPVDAADMPSAKPNVIFYLTDDMKSLATGKIAGFIPAAWHRLTLVLKGAEMTASVDGKEVARCGMKAILPTEAAGPT